MLPTQNDPIDKLKRMLAGLAFINHSTTLKEQQVKQQLQREYRLSETTLSQIVATLENDYHQKKITALQNEAEKREGWVGYYIKTTTNETGVSKSKEDHINITVMVNPQGDLQVVVKPEGERKKEVTYNQGSFKRATEETMFQIDKNGQLIVSNMVNLKYNQLTSGQRFKENINISREVIGHDPNAFTCFFPSNSQERNRDGDTRIYQANNGKAVSDLIFGETDSVDVNYAMQYMLQIGAQLSGLHEKGISHHDVKLENMLSRQVDGHPVFTLIDCPLQGETATPSNAMKESPMRTLGISCPPDTREVKIKDPEDPGKTVVIRTDSWSNGLYSSQDGKGDPQPEKDRIDKIWLQEGDENPIATKYWKSEKRFTGHVDDSYAYLRGLYLISCAAQNEQLFNFAIEKMQELADQTLAYVQNASQNSWPEGNLTVAKIQEAFAVYCNEKPSLKAAFNKAEEAGSGAVAGLAIPIPKRKDGKRVVGRGNRGGGRNDSRHVDTWRKPRPTTVAGANQTQPAVTVAMVLKEQRDISNLKWLWLLFLDCMTGKFGEGSRRTLYKNMYSAFHLEGQNQRRQVDFGWGLIAQSLENKIFETGRVEFAQALIVAEVYYALPTSGPSENMDKLIEDTINARVEQLPSTLGPESPLIAALQASTFKVRQAIQAIQAIQENCPCPEPNASARKPIPDLNKVAKVAAILRCCCKPNNNKPQ